MIQNTQRVRIRVRSSSESSGVVSATLTIGGISGTFTVKTVNFTGRVEAEAASPIGGATTVADAAASKGKAVFLGSAGLGISIAESLDAKALILAYRTDTAGTLEAKVNGASAGKFTLRPTAGAYATSSLVVSVHAGDVIAIASPSTAGSSETYLDYVEFAASPFRSVSTVATVADPWATDGVSVGSNGDIYRVRRCRRYLARNARRFGIRFRRGLRSDQWLAISIRRAISSWPTTTAAPCAKSRRTAS